MGIIYGTVAQCERDENLFWTEDGTTFLTNRLSEQARERYDRALWYVWGRDDAGDKRLRRLPDSIAMGNDFGFAQFAATEAEHYEQQRVCMLNNIGDQYKRYVWALTFLCNVTSL